MLFELEDVTATRAGRVVFEGLQADLADGATGIVGPSGVGKSTLLRLLNRLADPTAGTVRYRGRDLRERDVLVLRREVGLVPQLPALLEGTVADNILYGPRLAKRAADVAGSLRLAGLDPRCWPCSSRGARSSPPNTNSERWHPRNRPATRQPNAPPTPSTTPATHLPHEGWQPSARTLR